MIDGHDAASGGVLVVDKPRGMTSHDVVARVRRAAGLRRVGHTGTLDPSATGVLVVCLGRATRLVQFLQDAPKTYAARMVLGVTTDSQDADGEVVATRLAAHVDEQALCEAMTAFQGTIEQVPPMVSALKVDGVRLHERARRGEVVERQPRAVTVHDLVLDEFEPGEQPEASFLVTCSTGTYVRTLAHDIGARLGVGGSLTRLRRLANGPFNVDEAHDLDKICEAGERGGLDELLLSPVAAVRRVLATVDVDDAAMIRAAVHGSPLPAAGREGRYAVVAGDELVGIYHDDNGTAVADLVWMRPEDLA